MTDFTDAIPEDVIQAAREAVALLNEPGASMTGDAFAKNARRGEFDHWGIVKAAARAILAERERCATAIYEIGRETSMRGYIKGEVMGPAYYKEVIRKGVQP